MSEHTAPVRIYGAGEIAQALGVTTCTVSNYMRRHPDTAPQPDYVTGAAQRQHFYSHTSYLAWIAWHAERYGAVNTDIRGTA